MGEKWRDGELRAVGRVGEANDVWVGKRKGMRWGVGGVMLFKNEDSQKAAGGNCACDVRGALVMLRGRLAVLPVVAPIIILDVVLVGNVLAPELALARPLVDQQIAVQVAMLVAMLVVMLVTVLVLAMFLVLLSTASVVRRPPDAHHHLEKKVSRLRVPPA